jgi:hypothetical protein
MEIWIVPEVTVMPLPATILFSRNPTVSPTETFTFSSALVSADEMVRAGQVSFLATTKSMFAYSYIVSSSAAAAPITNKLIIVNVAKKIRIV